MSLLLLALENLCRRISEWIARRREVYIQPRAFDLVIEQTWAPRVPRVKR